MKSARLRPQAWADLKAAVRYYRQEAGRAVAERLVMAAQEALRSIESQPGIGSPRIGVLLDIPDLRAWRVSGFPLIWFYFERAERLDVVRLLGERQDILEILGGNES